MKSWLDYTSNRFMAVLPPRALGLKDVSPLIPLLPLMASLQGASHPGTQESLLHESHVGTGPKRAGSWPAGGWYRQLHRYGGEDKGVPKCRLWHTCEKCFWVQPGAEIPGWRQNSAFNSFSFNILYIIVAVCGVGRV